MRLPHVLIAATGACAAVALAASPASAAAQKTVATPAQLVYVSNHGDYDLWTVNTDGTGKAPLTTGSTATTTAWNSGKTEWAPVFSPDRTLLAYQSSRAGTPDVVVRNTTSGVYRVLAGSTTLSEAPSGWYQGSDAMRVAYVVSPMTGGGPYSLWSVRADGTGGAVQLLGTSRNPKWFAATATTGYVSLGDADGATRIYSFPIGTDPSAVSGALQQVTDGPNDANFTVSARGELIFTRTFATGSVDLWTLPAGTAESTTSPAQRLLQKGAWSGNPEISPKGDFLAYSSRPDTTVSHGDIYVASLSPGADGYLVAGTSKLVVGDPTNQDSQPTWSR